MEQSYMGIFIVVSLTDAAGVSPEAIEPRTLPPAVETDPIENALKAAYPHDFLRLSDGRWLVSADGTAKEVYEKIGGSPDAKLPLFLASIFGYWGFASANTWEWVVAKSAPKHVLASTASSTSSSA